MQAFRVGTANSNGYRKCDIRGTYHLANLLQELTLAEDERRSVAEISEQNITEDPLHRTSRRIRDMFWDNLTRRLDVSLISVAAKDSKDRSESPRPRIYVPFERSDQYQYYQNIALKDPGIKLDVQQLPEGEMTPEFVKSLNSKPGILALGMKKAIEDSKLDEPDLRGLGFVVPGGRFNEFYGWDTYFCSLGLLESGRVNLVKEIAQNYIFEIEHYGKILNANRSYYLCRSQPPFLTDLAIKTYDRMRNVDKIEKKECLRLAIIAAIKEYNQVWMSAPRYDPKSGLSRYGSPGIGFPPEVEDDHFDHIILPYATKHGMNKAAFLEAYNNGELNEPDLDEFLRHDRAVRESGHDTS